MANETIRIEGENLVFNRAITRNSSVGSYVISLPRIWIENLNLKPKMKLKIIMDKDKNLFIKNPNLKDKK